MYNLDIETLITVLQNRQVDGVFKAYLSTGGFTGTLGKGYAIVTLQGGAFRSISIFYSHGQVMFQGKDALNKIRRRVLAWELIETPSVPDQFSPRALPPPANNSGPLQKPIEVRPDGPLTQSSLMPVVNTSSINTLVPARHQQIPPAQLHAMSRTTRGIYSLVNGTNNVERIANLLALPSNVVYSELLALQNAYFIVFTK